MAVRQRCDSPRLSAGPRREHGRSGLTVRVATLATLAVLSFALTLGASGCSTSLSSGGSGVSDGFLRVQPSSFLGDLSCNENGVQRYVATITNVGAVDRDSGTDASTERVIVSIEHPSSAPISCNRDANFAFIRPGIPYNVEIDAYDRTDMIPLGTGSRIMVDPLTGETVFPRWVTHCGQLIEVDSGASEPSLALDDPTNGCCAGYGQIVTVRSCEPLQERADDD